MADPRRSTSSPDRADNARFVIVEARFYDDIGAQLLEGARRVLDGAGAKVHVLTVPGALEVPIALGMAIASEAYDGAVALGCIIRGETYHFEIVANESARALSELAVSRRLAFGNGILTVENEEQARVRADPAQGDKGGDAARAALALWRIQKELG